ncbi:MAG: GTP cyclohydrolase FolE2 [Cyanobacteria bacterium]|nr:GTP cyclohydrolase FolE2 [Cyanobacteriota bacterium]MDA1021537.1 GTP cyclohydrolase FolE2 [Cyanobacteriota bacterium]
MNKIIDNDMNKKPDAASELRSPIATTLDRVGMSQVELPVLIHDHKGNLATIPARAELYVSLDDPHAKGIHMSRLYLKAKEFFAAYPLSFPSLASLTEAMLETHKNLSFSAHVAVSFEYIQAKKALVSDETGYRFYPVTLSMTRGPGTKLVYEMQLEIIYSSTCPCSAALARQVVKEEFLKKFDQDQLSRDEVADWIASEKSQAAVPHAQRSKVNLNLKFNEVSAKLDLNYWINLIETTLATPVQAAVKREDEQEFARLNGTNMMFSEDAARRLKACLDKQARVADYQIKVEHLESLHAHNAVVITSKGVK